MIDIQHLSNLSKDVVIIKKNRLLLIITKFMKLVVTFTYLYMLQLIGREISKVRERVRINILKFI